MTGGNLARSGRVRDSTADHGSTFVFRIVMLLHPQHRTSTKAHIPPLPTKNKPPLALMAL